MPRDNHPRERQARSLARKKGKKPPHDRILIVCEGEKTEPLYFEEIRRENRVSSAHINVIHSAYGTQPRQIVEYAYDQFIEQQKAFERVYAVFDRDDHPTYHEALTLAESLDQRLRNDEKKPVTFKAIPSVPCFELWYLLHYQDVSSFYDRNETYTKLCGHHRDYNKARTNMYSLLRDRMPDAIRRSHWLRERYNAHQADQPYTDADVLTTVLLQTRQK